MSVSLPQRTTASRPSVLKLVNVGCDYPERSICPMEGAGDGVDSVAVDDLIDQLRFQHNRPAPSRPHQVPVST
jgi:hypothetical protein